MGRRKKKLGWIPNEFDVRDYDIDKLGLSLYGLSESKSLEQHIVKILNQGGSSSCVAQAIAYAVMILESVCGFEYDPISRLFIYWNPRKHDGGRITDSGTYPRSALEMLRKFGVPSEKYWPFSDSRFKINRQPPWNAYMKGHSRKDGKYVQIFDVGDQRVKAVQAAIDAEYPVIYGSQVSKSYLEDDGPSIIDVPSANDPLVGGHMQTLVGYREHNGIVIFKQVNSWSEFWRDGGFVEVTEDVIKWKYSSDFNIVYGWKKLRTVEA